MRVTERRIASRVETTLPASFVVQTPGGGQFCWLVGSITNASKSGILLDVRGSVDLQFGDEGQVHISIYDRLNPGGPLRYLAARAVVRRLGSAGECIGLTRLALEFRERLIMHTTSPEAFPSGSILHELGFFPL